MRQDRLGNLIAHAHHWIERRHGLLKDHADPGAANVAHPRFWHHQQVFTLELNAAMDARLWR